MNFLNCVANSRQNIEGIKGLGESCTHIAALLFMINGTVQIRESRTVSQEPAYWQLPASLKDVSYNATRHINFSAAKTMKKKFEKSVSCVGTQLLQPTSAKKQRILIPPPSEEELSKFYKDLAAKGRKPAILSLVKEHSDRYIPKILNEKFPLVLTELKNIDAMTMCYNDLLATPDKHYGLSVNQEKIYNFH